MASTIWDRLLEDRLFEDTFLERWQIEQKRLIADIEKRTVQRYFQSLQPTCKYCGGPVDEPGQVHAGGCGRFG